MFYNILLPIPTDGIYTYHSEYDIIPGQRVIVPLGKRTLSGICLEETSEPGFKCRDIDSVMDESPVFDETWLLFIKRISEYYSASLGAVLHGVIAQKLLSSMPPEKAFELGFVDSLPVELSDAQRAVTENISLNGYSAHLIKGVTGSGKTEIYLDLISKVITEGKQAIYLVPEISLTPQLVDRLTERLGFKPGVFHSKLTDKRRNEAFWSFKKGEQPLLLGARSALFVPPSSLGLIIVDEEHETTFKQEEVPSYQLRDMAVLYAQMNSIPVVMGSATPQVESIYNARTGKYTIHYLRDRHGEAELPSLHFIDLKESPTVGGVMAEPMYDRLYETVRQGNQAIIFLNRKGYATSLYCKKCGSLQECPNCSVALTMYRSGKAACHYCGEYFRGLTCGECGGIELVETGSGTEKVEEFLLQMFPDNVLRIDADKITTFKKLQESLKLFCDKSAQILVGTQLIAKGLHFPDVTFVGILGIDNIMSIPDFRAVEKAYQLVMQVSGRAGRGVSKGEVYIQTYMPQHPLFEYFSADPARFYDYELERRKEYAYPPYSKLARLIFSYSKKEDISGVADTVVRKLKSADGTSVVMGPAPAVVFKIKNLYRFSVIIKSSSNAKLGRLLSVAKSTFDGIKKGSMQLKVDRDPYFFM